ncbi:MAG: TIGR03621 family F420-dependent LLM class oxidoreductase [Acidimicrobiales bacterium]
MPTTDRPFRFAYQPIGVDERDNIVAAAQQAERLGYDEYYSSDHFGISDPFLPLLIAAEATTTLRFGPLVINNEFHNPALLARTAATFDRLSGGRLVLGMGTGYAVDEHDAIGMPLRARGPRVERLVENLGALRSLLDAGTAQLDGHDSLTVESLGVSPAQERVPFLVGANGKRLITLAAEHADILQFTGAEIADDGSLAPTAFTRADILRRTEWLASAAGNRLKEIEVSALVQRTAIGDAAAGLRAEISGLWNLEPDAIDGSPFALLGSSVSEVCDKIEGLREDLGISHFVVRDAEGFAPVVERLAGR